MFAKGDFVISEDMKLFSGKTRHNSSDLSYSHLCDVVTLSG